MMGRQTAEPAHRFGASPPLTIGVEEELLLVDDERHLVAGAERVMEELDPAAAEAVSTEIFAAQIELKTGICGDAAAAASELSDLRRAVRATGVGLLGAGIHPDDGGEAQLVQKPRYDVVKEDLASLLSTPPSGLHVHVGMPDPETAVRVANAMRLRLPMLAALAANSPFRDGADSGMASARAAEVRAYPRFEMPRAFVDYAEFLAVADQLVAAAGVDDYTYIWWDVRPHPKLGTVEVRGMDVQSSAAANAAFGALIQALAAREIERPTTSDLQREALEESYYQAGRHGLEARLMVDGGEAAPAREVAKAALAEARPYAAELGDAAALAEIERILAEGNGAERQRRAFERGGIAAVLEYLAAATAVGDSHSHGKCAAASLRRWNRGRPTRATRRRSRRSGPRPTRRPGRAGGRSPTPWPSTSRSPPRPTSASRSTRRARWSGSSPSSRPARPAARSPARGRRSWRGSRSPGRRGGGGSGGRWSKAATGRARGFGAEAIALWSRPYQTAAHALYESLGYRRLPERDEDDREGRRLVFRLDL